jgi:hypothetical protein
VRSIVVSPAMGDEKVKLCRACTANQTALKLLEQLEDLSVERHGAARLAHEIKLKRYPSKEVD